MSTIFDSEGMVLLAVFIKCCKTCNIMVEQRSTVLYVDYTHQFQIIDKWGKQWVLCERLNSCSTKVGRLVQDWPTLKSALAEIPFEFYPFDALTEK